MKLGLKTTGGVSKLKTKTTGDVVKAVECACCGCDPTAPWGPGYDTQPNTVSVLGYSLTRVDKCTWQILQCYCNGGEGFYEKWEATCGEQGGVCNVGDFSIFLSNAKTRTNGISIFVFYGSTLIADVYTRTGGVNPFPYGIYSKGGGAGPATITIS